MPYPFRDPDAPPLIIDWTQYANFAPGDSPSEHHWKEVHARRLAEQFTQQKPQPPTEAEVQELVQFALQRMGGDPEKATGFLLEGVRGQNDRKRECVDLFAKSCVFKEFVRMTEKRK